MGRPRGIADHHRHDGVVAGQDVEAETGHPLPEQRRVLAQPGPQVPSPDSSSSSTFSEAPTTAGATELEKQVGASTRCRASR